MQIEGLPKNIGPFQSVNIGPRFSTAIFDLSLLRKYQASVKAAASRVQLAKSLATQAHDLLSSGVATNIDVSRADVRVLAERQARIDAQSEIESNTFALRRILNVPDSQRDYPVRTSHEG